MKASLQSLSFIPFHHCLLRELLMVDQPPQTERIVLNFLIVGASVAGLSCAYGALINGHKAHVIERGTGVYQVCVPD